MLFIRNSCYNQFLASIHLMKKICILVVILTIAYAQQTQGIMAGQFKPVPTIAIHGQDVLDVANNQISQTQMKNKEEVILGGEHAKKNHPMLGGEENMMPILGAQEFNPFEFRPENDFENRPRHPRPNHNRPSMRSEKEQEEMFRNPRDRENQNRVEGEWERVEFRSVPGTVVPNHEDWQKHVEGNHMQKLKYHRKVRCMLITTAVVFTLVGICLAKCCRKCQKNRKERVRAMIMRSRSAEDIHQEIKHEETKLNQLKIQYANKRAEEERIRRQQEAENQAYEMHMRQRQMQQQQPRVYYAQPYPVQQMYNPRTQIPMGRPINQSNNSSFATEYPQL